MQLDVTITTMKKNIDLQHAACVSPVIASFALIDSLISWAHVLNDQGHLARLRIVLDVLALPSLACVLTQWFAFPEPFYGGHGAPVYCTL